VKRLSAWAAILILLAGLAGAAPPPSAQDLAAHAAALEKNLIANILAFWHPRCLDREHGGYIINFGPQGESKGPGTKGIVTQARTLWFFARMARAGYGGREAMLAAAETGYRFLRDKMWDAAHGGFYWEVEPTGAKPLRPGKHLYGQAFGLYALSEYALASGREDVLEFATRFFGLLDEKAHDPLHGGYIEFFGADWSEPPPGAAPYAGGVTGQKLLNTHLHLMEAISAYLRASGSQTARIRLTELAAIGGNAVVRKGPIACTDRYQRDWTPLLDGEWSRVSYGHDLENIWLLIEASETLGISPSPYTELFRHIFAYSLEHGFDSKDGGFFESGPLGAPAGRKTKIWWVQAEALVGALAMYKLTRDPRYYAVFEQTWRFVNQRQTDWEHGEWHANLTPEGEPRGDKANLWKGPYHNGRAMIECIAHLRALEAER